VWPATAVPGLLLNSGEEGGSRGSKNGKKPDHSERDSQR